MNQKMCDKAVNKCFSVFDYILDWYKTQKISNDLSVVVYCRDKYLTQKLSDKAVYEDPFLIVFCVLINI